MYKTEYGNFNGDTWEAFCKLCFKLKYEKEGYQDMPASPGDYGIEGFTRTGLAFQCYCPDMEYQFDELYEKQRNKITTDLNKLELYEKELSGYLKAIKISKWILVTPEYTNKDLVKHCQNKADEYRKKNLCILSKDYDVFVHDINFFAEQIPIVRNLQQKKIEINPKEEAKNVDIANWRNQQISYVENAIRKHGLRFPKGLTNIEAKVNYLTNKSITNLLNGNILIRKWQEQYQDDYERFERLKSKTEEKVIEECQFPCPDSKGRIKEIEADLKQRIKESFPMLDPIMIEKLSDYVMSDWILRCPLDFE